MTPSNATIIKPTVHLIVDPVTGRTMSIQHFSEFVDSPVQSQQIIEYELGAPSWVTYMAHPAPVWDEVLGEYIHLDPYEIRDASDMPDYPAG